ncbi:MAG: response regulator [Deltaproteobacteria bacterium]
MNTQEPMDPDLAHLKTLRVLFVEDDEGAREQLAVFLRRRVADLVLATSGTEGLAAHAATRPDLVVSDIQMPVMDGLTMAEELRRRDPRLPLIITTAFNDTHYLMRAIEVGVYRYVTKPVDTEKLVAALVACARELRAEAALAELRAREIDAAKARHLEAIGVLAGGMAHDFNNLLQGIMLNLSLADELVPAASEARALIGSALEATSHARDLGSQLLVLARGGIVQREPDRIDSLLNSTLKRVLYGSGALLDVSIAPDLPSPWIDRVLLGRAFMLVAQNAVEAMPGGGRMSVSARAVTVAIGDGRSLAPGEYVEIAFADTGHGIAPELLPRVFEPYVTTKHRGSERGTGLGLALCRAIMLKHDGGVTAESTPGGATLRLYLPFTRAEAATPPGLAERGLCAEK